MKKRAYRPSRSWMFEVLDEMEDDFNGMDNEDVIRAFIQFDFASVNKPWAQDFEDCLDWFSNPDYLDDWCWELVDDLYEIIA